MVLVVLLEQVAQVETAEMQFTLTIQIKLL
jgi:hypothetical protein